MGSVGGFGFAGEHGLAGGGEGRFFSVCFFGVGGWVATLYLLCKHLNGAGGRYAPCFENEGMQWARKKVEGYASRRRLFW